MLPDWIGYCLLLNGLLYISLYESSAKLLRLLGILLIIWGLVEELLKIKQIPFEINLITLIVTIVSLYFHFQLLSYLANIANRSGLLISSKILFLRNARTIWVTIFFVLYPVVDNYYFLMVSGVINVIIGLAISSRLFKLKRSLH